jgi:hypothetical protein
LHKHPSCDITTAALFVFKYLNIRQEEAMATVYEVREPKEAWDLVSHFLTNLLTIIGFESKPKEEETEKDLDQREEALFLHRARLIGNLYVIVRRLEKNGHIDESDKIREILDMVVDQDVTDHSVREAIHNKRRELDPNASVFETEFAKLRAEHEQA